MNDTKRGDNETDEEYFTRIARSYFRPTSVCDGDETDGVFLGKHLLNSFLLWVSKICKHPHYF